MATLRLGTSLGQDVYKIRLRISSKGKGKSGGARIISFVESFAQAGRPANNQQQRLFQRQFGLT